MNRDVATGLALAGGATGYLLLAARLPDQATEPGPRFLPISLAVALLLVSLSFVHEGWTASRRVVPTEEPDAELPGNASGGAPFARRSSTWVILATLAYVPAFHVLGFFASTILFVVAVAFLLGARRVSVVAALALSLAVLLYLLFGLALGVPLPLAPLGR